MASYVYSHTSFCHNGPRQGVYPLQQLQHYRAVSRRASQLRHPDTSYRHKIRVEPAVILPGQPSMPSNAIGRSSSTSSMSTRTTVKANAGCSNKGSASGPQFMMTTAAITIQPRQPLKAKTTPPGAKCHPPTENYLYLDPLKVKGDRSYEERLAEIAQHEANTIKMEEWNKSKRLLSRPSSARSVVKTMSTRSIAASTSRPTSAKSTSSTSSMRQRKSSISSATVANKRSHQSYKSSTVNTSSNDIHRSKSAAELKQANIEASSKTSLPETPVINKNQAETGSPTQPCAPRAIPNEEETKHEEKQSSIAIPLAKPCNSNKSPSDSEDSTRDDLNATSDLGLSIDSQQSSGEDTDSSPPTLQGSCKDPTGQLSVSAVDSDRSSVPAPVSFEVSITPQKHKRHKSSKRLKN